MTRKWLILTLACFAAASQASFELMLVPDRNNKKVWRVDPTTGTTFGSFGLGYLNTVYGVAVNPNKSEAYVSDDAQARLFVFNYNTGEYLREFALPTGQAYSQINVAANGDLLLSDYLFGGAARIASTNGALVATFNAPAGAAASHGIVEGAGGEVYVTWGGINKVARYTNSGGAATNLSAALAITSIDAHQATRSGSTGTLAMGTGGKLQQLNFLGSNATAGTIYDYSGTFTRVFGVAYGHGEQAYVSGDLVGGGYAIGRFNRVTGTFRGTFTIPGAAQSPSIALVVAPEPASFLVIGFGAAALIRLRRRETRQ